MTLYDDNERVFSSEAEAISRVLLVDDQLIVAEAFRRMFDNEEDIELHYCSSPFEAVAEAEDYKPTVILQDLVMPDMDGLSLLTSFRANAPTKAIPIIVLSTREDPKTKSEAFSRGASDYLVKFPDRIEVLARIRAHSRSYLAQQQRDEAFRELHRLKAQLERKNAELEALSCSDSLTGVLNRRGFDEYLAKEWVRAIRDATELGLLLIDVDFFKNYNDNYGHQDGDECLRHVAQALGAGLKRRSDIVARYGGEEFAVILPNTGIEGGALIAESLRAAVEALQVPHGFSEVADYVTVSVGLASVKPAPGQVPKRLIGMADKALYQSKDNGRNRCCLLSTTDEEEKKQTTRVGKA